MERKNRYQNAGFSVFFMFALLLALVSSAAHSALTIDHHDVGLSDQKNYYPPTDPNPHGSSPPKHHSSHSSPACPTPSHGSGGGGHSTPITPATPSHGSGGSHSYPSPTSGGSSPPTDPSITVPSPISGGSSPPTVPSITVPSPISGGSSPPTVPSITVPNPPVAYDPNVPPFHPGTCSYWISHPGQIVAVVGYLGTIGDIFGTGCIFAIGGRNPTLHDAVANTSADGIGALLREGTAALLNSLSCKSFPLTSQQVRSAFAGAVGNDGAASAQAAVFKLANEGQYNS